MPIMLVDDTICKSYIGIEGLMPIMLVNDTICKSYI